ncbi:MAG: hypothetical protein KDD25_06295 [Bdellovibrionales bacterium]|nr:hypothetical protein [Bdellovibrionales bacterium]
MKHITALLLGLFVLSQNSFAAGVEKHCFQAFKSLKIRQNEDCAHNCKKKMLDKMELQCARDCEAICRGDSSDHLSKLTESSFSDFAKKDLLDFAKEYPYQTKQSWSDWEDLLHDKDLTIGKRAYLFGYKSQTIWDKKKETQFFQRFSNSIEKDQRIHFSNGYRAGKIQYQNNQNLTPTEQKKSYEDLIESSML